MELVGGRSTTLLLFPIFMSAVLIHSSAALIVSAFALVPFVIMPGNILEVNFYAWGSVMGLAIVIWVACYVMEKAIREAREETYRSNAMLGIASHELRTPLGVIIGNLEMLKLQSSGGNANPATEAMEKSARCLNETITRLLDQAYIQSGKAQLQVSEVDIRELVGRVSGPIRESAKEKFLEFNVVIRNSVPEKVLIDPLRIEQILANLLENGVQYTTTGSVSLAVDLNETGEKKLTFTVADTGIGIPKNRIRSMFKPFFQGQRYDTRLHGGVGLGLSIVHELINLMNGKIIVNSTVGAGSTFLVTIPMEA
jgi:signal transduction histidine kinase